MIALDAAHSDGRARWAFRSSHVLIVCLYLVTVALSTIFGVAPLVSLFGSFYNQMGLMTHLCFLTCFLGLVIGIGASEARLQRALWAVAMTGLLVAAYALIQFSGRDPFLPHASYRFKTGSGFIFRVLGTMGHADYLGNFLLYTTLPSAALALATRSRLRWLALFAAALSIIAITCSGTRGAWAGLAVGLFTFVVLEMRGSLSGLLGKPRRLILAASITCIAITASIWAVSLSPMSSSIAVRACALIAEGANGAGRVLLWRDSIKMIPRFAITGAGPEGFRKAFLAYKSQELARLAPEINNESAHNSYLDAAISYGLPGAILYVAVIASSLSLLFGARRRARSKGERVIATGIFSALASVAVHNIFIFDQIPTGLYLFTFAALALAVSNVIDARENSSAGNSKPVSRSVTRVIGLIGLALVALAAWYALSITRADRDIRQALALADAGDVDRATRSGERATRSAEPTGAYDLLFAQVLEKCAGHIQTAAGVSRQPAIEHNRLMRARDQAIELAIRHAEKSIAHTLTPDSSYVLLAYLALAANDAERLRAYATEAIKWGPNYSDSRWLMAEAYLKDGDREQAAREAELALLLHPSSRNAASALARATSESVRYERTVAKIVARARRLADAADTEGARRLLLRAIRKSSGPCPECHRALALVYEMTNSCEEAIAQWQAFLRQDPARASTEQVESRIEQFRHKAIRGECVDD